MAYLDTAFGQLATPAVATSLPLPVAAGVMRRGGFDSVVVLDHGDVCGLLTDRNLLRTAIEGGGGECSVAEVCCRRLASAVIPHPVLVDADATAAEAAEYMLAADVVVAVVVGDQGVAGVVTGPDMLAAGEANRLDRLAVREVAVELTPLSLADDFERAVGLAAIARGRPMPVVADGAPLGTLRIPCLPRTSDPFSEPAYVPPRTSSVVTRRRDGHRFYSGHQRRARP